MNFEFCMRSDPTMFPCLSDGARWFVRGDAKPVSLACLGFGRTPFFFYTKTGGLLKEGWPIQQEELERLANGSGFID